MKKVGILEILLVIGGILFGFFVLFISIIKNSFQIERWEEVGIQNKPIEKSITQPISVDYSLPMPGILPDHIFYPIKMIKDRIWILLTIDPLKKAELFLFLADKRLVAGEVLINQGKEGLGLTTLSKAEKYLERALIQQELLEREGKSNRQFLEKLLKSLKIHQEILLELKERVSERGKWTIGEILPYSQGGYLQIREKLREGN